MAESTPLYPVAALGFRSWKLIDGRLRPISAASVGSDIIDWVPGENRAWCLQRGQHQVPAPGGECHCGMNAYVRLREVRVRLGRHNLSHSVVGAVAGYGRVELHEGGWRAEKARIVALFTPPRWRRGFLKEVEAAASSYGVPLVNRLGEVKSIAGELIVVPDECRPSFWTSY